MLADLPDTVFFHARDKLAQGLAGGHFTLLSGVAAAAATSGWGVEVVPYSVSGQTMALDNPRHLHIFLDDRPVYAPNAVHSVPAYLRGFWYFDEVGTRNNSSQRLIPFDPKPMSHDFARAFHAKLHARHVEANLSKFTQSPRGQAVAPGGLAVFAQDFKPPQWHRHYLTVPQMVAAAVAARGERAVFIKPHPNQTPEELQVLADFHDPKAGVHVTQASIHDLLAACDCVVTVTSAVGFEAFLHRKPVVLCGQTDFAQNAVTLTDPGQMGSAIAAAVGRHWPHEKFLVWYLKKHCVEDTAAGVAVALARLQRKGFAFGERAGQGFF